MDENSSFRGKYLVYTGYFLPLSQFDFIRWISDIADFRQPPILKTAGSIEKRTKLWTPEVGV